MKKHIGKISGISLIVLVVTIIVMAILAGTVIITISNTNVINEATKTKIRSDLSSLQDTIDVYVANNYMTIDKNKEYKLSDYGIDNKEYENITYIQNGRLYITSSASQDVQEIARELNMLRGVISSDIGSVKIDNSKLTNIIISGNSVQDGTPTPDNPVEIQSVGEKTRNIAILKSLSNIKEENGIYITTISDDAASLKMKIQFALKDTATYVTNFVDVSSPGRYSITITAPNEEWKSLRLANAGKTKEFSIMFDLPYEEYKGKTITISFTIVDSNVATCSLKDIQIEEGSTATEYEPYGYKIPVTVSGKNLFDINNEDNWVLETGNYYYYTMFVGANNTVCISWDNDLKLGQGFYVNIANDSSKKGSGSGSWLYHSTNSGLCKQNVVVTASAEGNIYINISNKNYVSTKLQNLQVEKGRIATEYEPYQGSTTTNIYLDEPLRKVGDYADYIDFASGKVVRNVKEVVLTGTENWTKYVSVDKHYQMTVNDNEFGNYVNNIMSNYYAPSKVIGAFYSTSDYAILSVDGSRIRIKDKDVSTVEEIKSKLAGYNDSGNPLRVIYHLKTQTEQSINLPSITSVKGTCIISCNTTIKPSKFEIEYK